MTTGSEEQHVFDRRAIYWRIRALTEQSRRELCEGQLAVLDARMKAAKTQRRLDTACVEWRALGGADLTIGEWAPNDATETFERRDHPPAGADPDAHAPSGA